jgi:hypothetical protein
MKLLIVEDDKKIADALKKDWLMKVMLLKFPTMGRKGLN